MNTFILNFNPFETKISAGQLATFIEDNRKVFQWYCPFAGTYILKSNEKLSSLAHSFRGVFEQAPFILTQAYPFNMGGAQTDVVWNWVNSHVFPSLDQTSISDKSQ